MDSHPVSVVRFASNAALALVVAAMVPSILLGVGPAARGWAGIVVAVALGGVAAQLVASAVWRGGLEASWDEQVQRSNVASYVFGYWAVLCVFLAFLAAVRTGAMSADAAFYWLGTPLAVGPSAYMLLAFLRGRAG